MPKKDASVKLNRRKFLTAAAVAGASGAVNPAKAASAAEPQQSLKDATERVGASCFEVGLIEE